MITYWNAAIRGSYHPEELTRTRSLLLLSECHDEQSFIVPLDILCTVVIPMYPSEACIRCILRERPLTSREQNLADITSSGGSEPERGGPPPTLQLQIPVADSSITTQELYSKYNIGDLVDSFLEGR
eukprot:PhF_6_TR40648/c0_g1_i4/m.61039